MFLSTGIMLNPSVINQSIIIMSFGIYLLFQVRRGEKAGLGTFFHCLDGQGQDLVTATRGALHGPQGTKIGRTLHGCRHG